MGHPLAVTDFNNRERVEPSVYAKTTLQKGAIPSLGALSRVLYLSEFPGGAPDTVKNFGDVQDLIAYHDPNGSGGASSRLAKRMKSPSTDVAGAPEFDTVRVGNPTQASGYVWESIRQNTAQSGTGTTIVLDAAASAVDDYYNGKYVRIVAGVGAGQTRLITDYTGTSKTCTVATWDTNPDSTSVFLVFDVLLTNTTVDYGTVANAMSHTIAADGIRRVLTLAWKQGTTAEELLVSPSLGLGLRVSYSGSSASALLTVTVSGTTATVVKLKVGAAAAEVEVANLDLTDTAYDTVGKVVAALNALDGVSASVDTGASSDMPSSYLDAVASAQCKVVTGTATAGGASTITLTGTSSTDDYYNGRVVRITAGTGVGQERFVLDYVGSTKVVTTDTAWTVQPDSTSVYSVDEMCVTAYLGGMAWWINSTSTRVTSTRAASKVNAPSATSTPEKYTGGTYPSTVLQDWVDALDVADAADLPGGYVYVSTTDASIQQAVLSWIDTQRTEHDKIWKTSFACAAGLSQAQIKAWAQTINSKSAILACQRVEDIDLNGKVTTFDPLELSAFYVGMSAGTPVTGTLTNKRVRVRALVDRYKPSDRKELMKFGLTLLKKVTGEGIKIAFALSSAQSSKRMERVWSEVAAGDFAEYAMTSAFAPYVGTWIDRDNAIGQITLATKVCDELVDAKVFTKGFDANGAVLPAYVTPTIKIMAGTSKVTWQGFTGGELDQIGILGDVEYQSFGVEVPL